MGTEMGREGTVFHASATPGSILSLSAPREDHGSHSPPRETFA